MRSFSKAGICGCFAAAALLAQSPFAEITNPPAGAVLDGIETLVAHQLDLSISPFSVTSVEFQYSYGGGSWQTIQLVPTVIDEDFVSVDWTRRDITWDTSLVATGIYALRAQYLVTDPSGGSVAMETNTIQVRIVRGPTAQIKASPGIGAGSLVFDGSASSSGNGSFGCAWDFGDGQTGTGCVVRHTYSDLSMDYTVALTVNTDLFENIAYADVFFVKAENVEVAADEKKCICKDITLRTAADKTALGPTAKAGGKAWSAVKGIDDGKTLGPLSTNPGTDGVHMGYAFEILCEVDGDPDLCKEIQLVKRTATWSGNLVNKNDCEQKMGGVFDVKNNLCVRDGPWKGKTADLDLDGKPDIDVSTQAKCQAAGGVWDAAAGKCTLRFPKSGAKFGPDTPEDTRKGGAYSEPYDFKAHAEKAIIWYDAPNIIAVADKKFVGTKNEADFISIIRGTDGKYCYVAYTLSAAVDNNGAFAESLTQTGKMVGAANVPNVP